MFRDTSDGLAPIHFSTTVGPDSTPPSPPGATQVDLLDDIYGSVPSSPLTSAHSTSQTPTHEILSDLPSRRRVLDNDAYREGLSATKGQYVQEGFDEGFSLGANLGQRVGYVLGVLQALLNALRSATAMREGQAREMMSNAENELAIQNLLGPKWIDEEGVFKWNVKGEEEEVTFREVAEQHPVISQWLTRVVELAADWNVDLHKLQRTEDMDSQGMRA